MPSFRTSVRLVDFYSQNRFRLIGPTPQLFPYRCQSLFQVFRQFIHGHPVDPRTRLAQELKAYLVGSDSFQGCSSVLSLTYFLPQSLVSSRVLGFSPRPGRLGPFRFAPRSFTPLDEREGQLFLPFLPLFTHEIRYLLTTPIVRAFAPSPELLCPLLTSALRSGRLSAPSVALPRHRTDLLG